MSTKHIEIKMLEDYHDAVYREFRKDEPKDLDRQLKLFENQFFRCAEMSLDFNLTWYMSQMFYLRAYYILNTQGSVEKTLREMSDDDGFFSLFPLIFAHKKETKRIQAALSLFDQAIGICSDDSSYWFARANIYLMLKDKESALYNLKHILSKFSHDEETYIKARKMKDEIELS